MPQCRTLSFARPPQFPLVAALTPSNTYKAPETYKIWRSSLTVKADLFSVEPEKSRGTTGRQESKPNRSVGVLRRALDGVEAAASLKLREIGAVHG